MDHVKEIDRARAQLFMRRTLRHGGRTMTIALLIREVDWVPIDAPWRHGKEAYIIGADLDGNFFLRHCDGSVRYWDHRLQTNTVIAPSVREFVRMIE